MYRWGGWRREKRRRRREEDVGSKRRTEAQTEQLDFHGFFISRKFNIYILVYSPAVEEELTSGLLQQQAPYSDCDTDTVCGVRGQRAEVASHLMSATLSAVLLPPPPPSLALKEKWALPFCGVGGSSGRNSTMCGLFAWRRRQPRLMTCMMPDSTSLVLQLRGPDAPPARLAPPDASCFWHESRTCGWEATESS